MRSALRGLRSGDEGTRREAATRLNDLSIVDLATAIPALAAAMQDDPSTEVRAEATRTMGTLGGEAIVRRDGPGRDQALAALLKACDARDPGLRLLAITMIPILAQAAKFQSDNPNDLRLVGDPAVVVAKLLPALNDSDEALRKAAARTLGSFPVQLDAHLPDLFARAVAESPAGRPGPGGVMVGLLRQVRPLAPSVPFLMQQLGSPDPRTRALAAATLGQAEADAVDAVPELIKILNDSAGAEERDDPGRAAATALGTIAPGTPRAAEAKAALEAAKASPPKGRERAINGALRNFDPPAP